MRVIQRLALALTLVIGAVALAQASERRSARTGITDPGAALAQASRSSRSPRTSRSPRPPCPPPQYNGAGQQVGPYCFESF